MNPMKSKQDFFDFMERHPVFFLATAEGTSPHARAIRLYRADGDGIVFSVGRNKEVHRQLLANPQVELCFVDAKTGVQVRVAGRAKAVKDLPLKREIAENMPFLQSSVRKDGYGVFEVFRVRNGLASCWTMASWSGPKNYVEF
jgi:pyridoxamine 5'-phosphate oxidase